MPAKQLRSVGPTFLKKPSSNFGGGGRWQVIAKIYRKMQYRECLQDGILLRGLNQTVRESQDIW